MLEWNVKFRRLIIFFHSLTHIFLWLVGGLNPSLTVVHLNHLLPHSQKGGGHNIYIYNTLRGVIKPHGYNYILMGSWIIYSLNGLNMVLNGGSNPPQGFQLKKKKGGNNNMESLKNYSRAVNIIVFICSLITYLGVDGLNNIVPEEYKYIIPTIIMIAGFVLVQLSEEARVERAQELVKQGSGVNARNESKKLWPRWWNSGIKVSQ